MGSQNHFLIRKLHSLSGIIPVGIFLVEHLFINSFAAKGAEAFDEKVAWMQSIPFMGLLEIFVVALPLLFHALYGIYIAFTSKGNVGLYGYYRNWFYSLQRWTGIIAFIFVIYHVSVTRLNNLFLGWEVSFSNMAEHLANPLVLAFYVVGLVSATFHFANGLWAFLVSWGITIGPNAQRVSTAVCSGIFLVITALGVWSLIGFTS